MRLASLTVALCVAATPIFSAQAEQTACQASRPIRSLDELFRADGQVSQMEMRVVRPRSTRTLRMRFWFENGGRGGEDRALSRVEAPATERGVASLRLGSKMWSFVPSTGRVQQVPESMMLSSWMGSDWTNDDMVRESSLLEDYRATSCRVLEEAGSSAYRIELRSRPGRDVSWDKMVVFVRRGGENDLMPLRMEYFSRRAGDLVLARTMTFAEYRNMGGRRLPARWILTPAGRQGQRTELRFLSIRFNAEIPDSIFSLRTLQRAR